MCFKTIKYDHEVANKAKNSGAAAFRLSRAAVGSVGAGAYLVDPGVQAERRAGGIYENEVPELG